MSPEEFELLIKPIINKVEADDDPYYLVHFSRSHDGITGLHEGLDKFDAIIIMKQLFQLFNMTDDDLQTFYVYLTTQQK